MEEIRLTHLDVGELYLEFSKCEEEDCSFCSNILGQNVPQIPRPVPNQTTKHYKTYEDTGLEKRRIDEFQPRFQCKKLFNEKKLKSNDPEKVKNFSEKYLVKPSLVSEYLNHLQDLSFKKDKRKQETQAKKNQNSNSNIEDDTGMDPVSVSDDESLDEYDNDDEDVIMNVIDGSDDDESENEEVVYVPKLRTLTRGGRLAGTWQTCFSLDNEAESDEEANSDSDSVENDEPDSDSDSVKAVTSRVSKRVLSDSESANDSGSDSSSEDSDTSEDERNIVRTRTGRVSKRPNRIDV